MHDRTALFYPSYARCSFLFSQRSVPLSPLLFDDGVLRPLPDVSHRLRCYTASVAFPQPASPFFLNIQVMYGFTISTVIIARFTSYVRFIFTSHGPGRFSICPSFRLIRPLSQRLLTFLQTPTMPIHKGYCGAFQGFPGRFQFKSIYIDIQLYEHL